MSTTLEHPTAENHQETPVDVCAVLAELGESCRTKSRFYREALRAVASHFASPYAAIRITQAASTLHEHVTAETDDGVAWESAAEDALLHSQAENVSIARLYGVKGTSLKVAVLAVTVCERPNRPIGAISLIARCDNATFAKAYLSELAALVSLIATRARQIGAKGTSATQDDSALKRAGVKATTFDRCTNWPLPSPTA